MSFSFGTPKTTAGFTLPTATPTSVGDARPQEKPAAGFLGTPTTKPGFSLGLGSTAAATTPKAAPTFSFGTATATATTSAAPAFSFDATTAAAAPSLSFTSTAATTTAPTLQFNLGSAANTTAPSSFTPLFGTSTATATTAISSAAAASIAAPPLKLTASVAAVTTAPATSAISTPATSLATSLAATSASSTPATILSVPAVTQPTTLTYSQLEDSINKWSIDIDTQAKFFMNQAKELNTWDSLLIANNDKIKKLNETIERVKQQQRQLDQELDFVLAQQNELDELSKPLEKQLADIPITDQGRFQMYQLSEVIDSQLKQMSEDLKEIVEHLNETNKADDLTDPVSQVSHILNAHMNSLQWIDRNTNQISTHLEQISKIQDVYKKNNLSF